MTYEELKAILNGEDVSKAYKILTSAKAAVKIDDFKKQWNAATHSIFDPANRPDKTVMEADPVTPANVVTKTVKVGRIPIPFQKMIVNKAVSFLFGNPVIYTSKIQDDAHSKLLEAINKVLDDNKMDSKNREVARQLFRSTEVAEIWFPSISDSGEKRIRSAIFSPWDGSDLYPFFDEFGDMIAFCREYEVEDVETNEKKSYFNVYTAEQIHYWVASGGVWGIDKVAAVNKLGKIPVVYASQEQVEWADVQYAIERLETLLSNHADTNDYHGSPALVAKGKVKSLPRKGEPGKFFEVDEKGSVDFISWNNAPESIKLEIDNLFELIYTFTHTPDNSFSSVKGINSISGIALKLLFMDAHLKVMDKRETFDPYLARRTNIIKAYLSKFDVKGVGAIAEDADVRAEIKPFMLEDLKERIAMLVTATGAKSVLSQETAAGLSGLVDDGTIEFDKIRKEAEIAELETEPTL